MNTESESVVEVAPKKAKKDYIHKKVDLETAKQITNLRDKINNKSIGRSATDSEIIAMAVSLIKPEHIKILQEATYSDEDSILVEYHEYIEQHGKITLRQFLKKLRRGELVPVDTSVN
ncbi:MAG: hypothetical protein AB7O96_09070 [Pseudobdellovibrionaceae bacterium]